MTIKPPHLILLFPAFFSACAFATGPASKTTKKRAPQRATYSAVNPFAAKDPFVTGLAASTSTTAPITTRPSAMPNSNPYLNLNPKPSTSTHTSHTQHKN